MHPVKIEAIPAEKKKVKEFVLFQKQIYQSYPHFVPPIYNEVIKFILNGPFNNIGEKQLFMAYRGEKPVARLSVHRSFAHNDFYKTNQGFFGFFEAENDPEAVKAIFQEGESWLKAKGCTSAMGPMNFAVYDEIALLIDSFDTDPVLLCTYNPPYYKDLLEQAGYGKEVDWYAYLKNTDVPNFMRLVNQRVMRQKGVVIREVNMKKFKEEANSIKHIFNEAWAENWGNVPFNDEQWEHLIKELKLIIDPQIAFITELDGVPIGFSISLLDANQAVKKANGRLFPFGIIRLLLEMRKIKRIRTTVMGVLKEYRNRGYDIAMIHKTIENGVKMGIKEADCSLIVETNHAMIAALDHISAQRYKTYRIFRKNF